MPNNEKQAFPSSGQGYAYAGMTLRDWFAGQALCGFCAEGSMFKEQSAKASYEYADAMLAEREKS